MAETEPIRVMLVDDHGVVRSGLKAMLAAEDDLELAGEAADGSEAVRFVERFKPDVILMDLLMPVMDGVAATKAIHDRWPDIRIIVLTSFKEREQVDGALKAGAMSYLLKTVSASELVSAIRGAMAGQSKLSSEATQVLIQEMRSPAARDYDLTAREKEILKLMVDGLPNTEIADKLGVSPSTAKFHVSNVLSKLGVSSRTEAVSLALKQKLVK
ncbi:two-component system, NarL family, response regulator LiaR [Dehalogenimonas formicexedens]|uniref:Two-component system, NarL family, response regulator LiaR n=1 Tax=Dehalogenimonas formicexedens TaxID=1839801 RepID=A0A1P8F6F7_9CHLR|nr:response regulator transcription factor [Dehalogenimonas formicexedens]APV44064.1 two-component system, NarL family, response regulator LiaR [Dehalogenimonas formicexedens]APV45227.1 two-component system, NarL family, response regulator LiaR [Dehalogenimonas formicexedens]